MIETETDTLIIGASIAGLATAACLQKKKNPFIILEKEIKVAAPWHRHYDRLHLHTPRSLSNLPYKKFAKEITTYPSRLEVVDYLLNYQKTFSINPIFNNEVISIRRENGFWIVETSEDTYKSKNVVVATGAYTFPKKILIEGMETFPGKIIHSSEYKTGKEFKGKKVLVIGFGNSACEIALDLYEQEATPSMSLRSPVNIIPRDIFGIPVLRISWLMQKLSPGLADKLNAPLIKYFIGDLNKLGIEKKKKGPLQEIDNNSKPPVIDIGTLKEIKKGNIKLYGEIIKIEGNTVFFKNGSQQFDVIIAAIGYDRNDGILKIEQQRFDDLKFPVSRQKYFGKDGLYFCGFYISPLGQIHEIASDAKKIAHDLQMRRKSK
ncbi:MAG: flavin-containing monooxygenase [Ginsengibacter sp.]